jgi:hypothetical protein
MCGGVKVTLEDQGDKGSAYCHCLNCKRQSGASEDVSFFPELQISDIGQAELS